MSHFPDEENLVTKINYSPRLKGLFLLSLLGVSLPLINFVDRNSIKMGLPNILFGHLNDCAGGFGQAALNRTLGGGISIKRPMVTSFIINSGIEIAQGFHLMDGTFDWLDFGAYAVGSGIFGVYDYAAKLLYQSGITIPIYRRLGIQDRRTDPIITD